MLNSDNFEDLLRRLQALDITSLLSSLTSTKLFNSEISLQIRFKSDLSLVVGVWVCTFNDTAILSGFVAFVGGASQISDIRDQLSQIDIYAITGVACEEFGLVLIEPGFVGLN